MAAGEGSRRPDTRQNRHFVSVRDLYETLSQAKQIVYQITVFVKQNIIFGKSFRSLPHVLNAFCAILSRFGRFLRHLALKKRGSCCIFFFLLL